mmetsp:Transcript_47273/g.111291  ORF Transcript_47273/g.111291 Transcript_47273/m.111291 type:complete len:225 (-) Transcript_47273:40-714(-)
MNAEVQAHLTKAEALWQQGQREEAIGEYDAALEEAAAAQDKDAEAMVLVGKGFALLGAGGSHFEAALEALERAKGLSETPAQVEFIENLMTRAKQDHDSGGDVQMPAHAVLQAAGVEAESCEGEQPTGCLSGEAHSGLGLEEPDQALVELIARDGAGDWESKAVELAAKFPSRSPEELAETWRRIEPEVREKLKGNPEMPCGHTCGTCPTKSSCHLHDIEDLMG